MLTLKQDLEVITQKEFIDDYTAHINSLVNKAWEETFAESKMYSTEDFRQYYRKESRMYSTEDFRQYYRKVADIRAGLKN